MVGVYVNKDLQRKLEEMEEWVEGREEGVRVVIRGTLTRGQEGKGDGSGGGRRGGGGK